MPPTLALLIWFVLIVGLLIFDPAKQRESSVALWVPVTWMFFVGSRMPSDWLGGQVGSAAAAFEESNPLNRAVFLGLTLMSFTILVTRSFRWYNFFTRNLFLMALLTFALLSVSWSDYPSVTIRRWFRDLGIYLVILVALSDPDPLEAVRTLLRRLSYLIIPLSIILVKYFPEQSRVYDPWSGGAMATGVTTSKNMLGVVCLVSGLFFVWDFVMRWRERRDRRVKRILQIDAAFIGMTIWLLNQAKSATSNVCLAIGSVVILLCASKMFWRHSGFFKKLIPVGFCLYAVLAYWFNANAYLVGAVGRNPTLTDRTYIWKVLLNMGTNPVVGTGYRSFFLGERLQTFWLTHPGINEAHNGYLDIYLNLGIIGLVLLGGFLISSYLTIWKRFNTFPPLASLGLAIWTLLLFYNITEASFDGGVLWMSFIVVGIAVPGLVENRAHSLTRFEETALRQQSGSLQPVGVRSGYAPDQAKLNTHPVPPKKI